MEKVLVTGAGGYIGSYVVKALLDMGHPVVATDFSIDRIDARAERIAADIFASEDGLYEKLGSPDVLIHMAWRDGFVHNSPAHFEDLPKHLRFIEYMLGAGVKKLSVMGSMHEIGFYEGAVDETVPERPSSLYGIAKNALRQAVASLKTNASICWLRGYYVVGDDSRNHSIFAKLLEKAAAGETTFPFTTGKNRYDFLSVDELGLQIALASVQSEITGVINCCSGKPVSLKDKVEAFIREKGLTISLAYGAFPDRPYDSSVIYGDSQKIRAIAQTYVETHQNEAAKRAAKMLAEMA